MVYCEMQIKCASVQRVCFKQQPESDRGAPLGSIVNVAGGYVRRSRQDELHGNICIQ